MSARENILKATLENQPALVPLPIIDFESLISYDDVVAQFEATLTKIGGRLLRLTGQETLQLPIHSHAETDVIINTLDLNPEQKENLKQLKSFELENVHTAYIRGSLGVAENGAVWVEEDDMVNRVLPFICQHLVLVLNADQVVATMHHAYQRIEVDTAGFAAFIAGPSKTADIEQSLVIGAHGPRSLTLILQVAGQDKL